MFNNQCGCNRFNEEPFIEVEEMVDRSRRNRCCEDRCARQFAHCLRECRRNDHCDWGSNRCNRCGCNRW